MEHFKCYLIRAARVCARVMHFMTQGRLGSRAGFRVSCQVFVTGPMPRSPTIGKEFRLAIKHFLSISMVIHRKLHECEGERER